MTHNYGGKIFSYDVVVTYEFVMTMFNLGIIAYLWAGSYAQIAYAFSALLWLTLGFR